MSHECWGEPLMSSMINASSKSSEWCSRRPLVSSSVSVQTLKHVWKFTVDISQVMKLVSPWSEQHQNGVQLERRTCITNFRQRKAHIIRTFNQDEGRINVLDDLKKTPSTSSTWSGYEVVANVISGKAIRLVWSEKENKRRSDPVLWQNPYTNTKFGKSKDNTQTPPKTTQRLQTDLGRSVGVTSDPTGVVKPVYGYPSFPLTANQSGEFIKIWYTNMSSNIKVYQIQIETSTYVTRHSGWWPHTVTPSIDRTLHQFLTITDLDLITEFDFLPNCARFP